LKPTASSTIDEFTDGISATSIKFKTCGSASAGVSLAGLSSSFAESLVPATWTRLE